VQQEAGAARQQLIQAATALEAHMVGRTYIAGQQLSLADLVLAADLKPAFEQVWTMLPAAANTQDEQHSMSPLLPLAVVPVKFFWYSRALL
jgi:glutathione S-transferase